MDEAAAAPARPVGFGLSLPEPPGAETGGPRRLPLRWVYNPQRLVRDGSDDDTER